MRVCERASVIVFVLLSATHTYTLSLAACQSASVPISARGLSVSMCFWLLSLSLSQEKIAMSVFLSAIHTISHSLPTTISSLPPLVALVCMSHLCKHIFIHILLLCLFSVCHTHSLSFFLSPPASLHQSQSLLAVCV